MNVNHMRNGRRLFLSFWLLLILAGAVMTVGATPAAQSDDPASIPPPDTVTIAGTIQPQLGCSGEWNTTCPESMLTYDPEADLWLAVFDLKAGNYEYKAALNGTWADNYGLNAEYYGPNIPLEVPADGPVTFWYDHKTRWVNDDMNSLFAIVTGTFQSELGCAEDGQVDCLRSFLQDPDGDGVESIVEKRYAMGRFSHENAVVMPDGKTVYHGDDGTDVVFFKFVADEAGDLSAGTLSAAKVTQNDDSSFGFEWIELGAGNDEEIAEAIRLMEMP